MNNWQAIQSFWEEFGLDAYDDQTVFTEGTMPSYPHITYQSASGNFAQQSTLTASIWYRSYSSWAEIKDKADQIRKAIGSGIIKHTDEGIVWFRVPEFTTFAQPVDSGDDSVRRIVVNVEVEFLNG